MGVAHRGSGEGGATLVELLVVMVISAVIGGVALGGTLMGYRSVRTGEERLTALRELQTAVERVAREVRAANATGQSPLTAALPDRVETIVDRNGARRRYEYQVSGGTLIERTGPPVGPFTNTRTMVTALANTPASPVFRYFDADGDPTTTAAQVHRVRITFTREIPGRSPVTVETVVRLRNAGGQ